MAKITAYSSHDSNTWSRIDMLLALYEGAGQQTRLAIEVSEARGNASSLAHRTRAAALVTAIRTGIDPSFGELPVKVDQLCEFVQHCLMEGDIEQLQSAERVLQHLNEAFQGIRCEARQLEAQGEIPPLMQESTLDTSF